MVISVNGYLAILATLVLAVVRTGAVDAQRPARTQDGRDGDGCRPLSSDGHLPCALHRRGCGRSDRVQATVPRRARMERAVWRVGGPGVALLERGDAGGPMEHAHSGVS